MFSEMVIHIFFDLLSYLVAGVVSWKYFKNQNSMITDENMQWYYYAVLVFGFILGSIGLSTLNNYFSLNNKVILGKSILGALFGGILSSELFKWKYKIKGSTGAYFVPSLSIGISIGRIGCFMAGLEDYTYGTVTDLSWGIDFGDGNLRHPVQLYESIAMFGFFLYSLWVYKYQKAYFEAKIFYIFVLFYATQRFIWEFLKPYTDVIFALNIFQLVCLALMVYAIIYLKRSAYGTLFKKI